MHSVEMTTQSSYCSFQESGKPQDDMENKNEGIISGNCIISSTSCLNDFQPVRDSGLPLAFCLRSLENLDCVLIDMFSEETIITNITDFGRTISQEMNITRMLQLTCVELLYSKEGWMFFRGPDSTGSRRGRFLLLNIFTGEKLHLPDNNRPNLGRKYVFSTTSSSVDYVVNVSRQDRTGWTTIYVARPHDQVWKVYTNDTWHGIYCFDYISLVMFENKVYCFEAVVEDSVEMIDVFDLVERVWTSFTISQAKAGNRYKSHIMEVHGFGIVKMHPPSEEFNMYRFFKLEVNEYELLAAWVEMTEEELENKSWFVGSNHPFCVKTPGKEAVYNFTTEVTEAGEKFGLNVQFHDLKADTSQSVLARPMYPAIRVGWVNLG